MKMLGSWIMVGMALASASVAQLGRIDEGERAPPPAEILARVRATFPESPWRLRGELICRDADDRVQRTYHVDLWLDVRGSPAQARVQLCDAFGVPLATLHAKSVADEPPTLQLQPPDRPAVPIPPSEPALDTDLHWGDLVLDFLWWTPASYGGLATVRGRECHVVDVTGPSGARYERVRMWVDAKEYVLLRADALVGGKVIRRVSVQSLRKVEGRWMLEDFQLESPSDGRRATLRVRESRPEPEGTTP